MIFRDHLDGMHRSRLGRREGIGAATVERYFQQGLKRQFGERHPARVRRCWAIDEHFFIRRSGYAQQCITEGFHNQMELINRQAYGFRNFQNYRRRVKVLCS